MAGRPLPDVGVEPRRLGEVLSAGTRAAGGGGGEGQATAHLVPRCGGACGAVGAREEGELEEVGGRVGAEGGAGANQLGEEVEGGVGHGGTPTLETPIVHGPEVGEGVGAVRCVREVGVVGAVEAGLLVPEREAVEHKDEEQDAGHP